jgi:2-dehydro-3-deoxy-D-arabinonate dehydratase
MTAIVRIQAPEGPRWAVEHDGRLEALPVALGDLLALPLSESRSLIERGGPVLEAPAVLLPPVDDQEVWAAGVTYLRSRDGRIEESVDGGTPYDRVYDAERPELFLKSTAARVVTDGDTVGIRADSDWNVPEPELAVVVTSRGEIFGYLVANDMSSRSIEGENPLYLPQAKYYDRACVLGSRIVPAWAVPAGPWSVQLRMIRAGTVVFEGSTSTAELRRDPGDLARWLVRALTFPTGAVLLTGTGIVPPAEVTAHAGDVVEIGIEGIGTLRNSVVVIGERDEG